MHPMHHIFFFFFFFHLSALSVLSAFFTNTFFHLQIEDEAEHAGSIQGKGSELWGLDFRGQILPNTGLAQSAQPR